MKPADELLAHAREATHLEDLGADDWREALERLWDSVASEAALNAGGQRIFEAWVGERLRNRLRLEAWSQAHPEALQAPVNRPIFILGMLRTGTTILSELLTCDPQNRPLMKWEALDAIPPPRPDGRERDPRVERTVERVERMFGYVPDLKAIHYERGDGPTECVALLGQSFRSQDWAGLFHIPSYTHWLHHSPMHGAYAYHRKCLQVLQSEWSGRWSLKAPGHMFALDELIATYPDARLVVTHRNPLRTVASSASLSLQSHPGSLCSIPELETYFGQMWLELLHTMVEQMMDFRRRHPEVPVLDLRFEEFAGDPISALEKIYAFDGRELTPETLGAMRLYLDQHPRGRHGQHRYGLSDFGLTPAAVSERFAPYCRHFDIPLKNE